MSDPADRTTSHAKTLEVGQQPRAIEGAVNLREHFADAKARAELPKDQEPEKPQEGQKDRAGAPSLEFRPSGAMRRDGEAHQRAAARREEVLKAINARNEKKTPVDLERDADRTKDDRSR